MSKKLHVDCISSCDKPHAAINILPDDVLLHILYFDRLEDVREVWRRSLQWYRLVHVCRRWRSVVFASPNFLSLILICDPWTRVELTGIWPPLPIIIRNGHNLPMPRDYDFGAAIVHPNRVCQIQLIALTGSQLGRLASAMQEQFPSLAYLSLVGRISGASVLPDGFLGGSAPRLQSLRLHYITFPALPKLLLSATELVRLDLLMPDSRYILPEAIVPSLAVLAKLDSLTIKYIKSRAERESRRPPPPIRTALPALTRFEFEGSGKYLEDLVSRIDAPFLETILITFDGRELDIPQFAQFMRRMTNFESLNDAHVFCGDFRVKIESLPHWAQYSEKTGLSISCRNWQLSSVAHVFTSVFPSIHMVERLYFYGDPSRSLEDIADMQWLELFHPFTAVKDLHLAKGFVTFIAPILQELVGERVTEVLPALQNIFLPELWSSGPVLEAIQQFVTARQRSGHSVAVHYGYDQILDHFQQVST